MRVLFDCTLLTAGGGIQVGLSLLRHAIKTEGLEIAAVCSLEVASQLEEAERAALARLVVARGPGNIEKYRLIRQCPEVEDEFNPDVVFTVFGPAYWKSRAPRLQGFAVPRLIYPEVVANEGLSHSWRARMVESVKRRALKSARGDAWVVETEVVRRRLSTTFDIDPTRIFVVPNTYSAHLRPSPFVAAAAEHRVFVPSSYYSHKNLEIIPAVAKAIGNVGGMPVRFAITLDSRGESGRAIQKLAEDLGVKDRLEFLGQIPVNQLAAHYSRASVVLLPTLLECSSAVYPESFICGVPLVTSDRDFARELCGDAALYADPHDPAELADRIRSAIEDEPLRQRLASAGRAALEARYLTPEEKWQAQLALLRKVAAGRSAGAAITTDGWAAAMMFAFSKGRWHGPLVAYDVAPGQDEIQVDAMCTVQVLRDLYFVRQPRLRMLLNYAGDIGWLNTFRKVLSRRAEALRNDKVLSIGIGRRARGAAFEEVAFIAPAHPRLVTKIALPTTLVFSLDRSPIRKAHDGCRGLCTLPEGVDRGELSTIAGWQMESGIGLDADLLRRLGSDVSRLVSSIDWDGGQWHRAPRLPERPRRAPRRRGAKVSASLFGYGNYAKTVIMPSSSPWVSFDYIHELDPTQLGSTSAGGPRLTTSTTFVPGEDTAAVFVASYHHTHADLAIEGLRLGKAVVVEKPFVTTQGQLDRLTMELGREGARFFGCFQKRYSIFNDLLNEDLGDHRRDPISYHCIVYEVPLPQLHWYRWPVSRSRLLSNGCHWIDHFLYLNDFAEAIDFGIQSAGAHALNCTIILANGAAFTMTLTELGSPRIGVQDYVELRCRDHTIRISNSTKYECEGPDGIVRRAKAHKMQSYRAMYKSIARRLRDGSSGDTLESVTRSSAIVIGLEDLYQGMPRRMDAQPAAGAINN